MLPLFLFVFLKDCNFPRHSEAKNMPINQISQNQEPALMKAVVGVDDLVLYALPPVLALALKDALAVLLPEWHVHVLPDATDHPFGSVGECTVLSMPAAEIPEGWCVAHHIVLEQSAIGEMPLNAPFDTAFDVDPGTGQSAYRVYRLSAPCAIDSILQILQAIATEAGKRGVGVLDPLRLKPREKHLLRTDLSDQGGEYSVMLTDREMAMVGYLLHHPGGASRARLLHDVWGYAADVETQTLETHVSKLRQKLKLIDVELLVDEGYYRLCLSAE
jgi:hypothetical protein